MLKFKCECGAETEIKAYSCGERSVIFGFTRMLNQDPYIALIGGNVYYYLSTEQPNLCLKCFGSLLQKLDSYV